MGRITLLKFLIKFGGRVVESEKEKKDLINSVFNNLQKQNLNRKD